MVAQAGFYPSHRCSISKGNLAGAKCVAPYKVPSPCLFGGTSIEFEFPVKEDNVDSAKATYLNPDDVF
jgi:hypothetical protein